MAGLSDFLTDDEIQVKRSLGLTDQDALRIKTGLQLLTNAEVHDSHGVTIEDTLSVESIERYLKHLNSVGPAGDYDPNVEGSQAAHLRDIGAFYKDGRGQLGQTSLPAERPLKNGYVADLIDSIRVSIIDGDKTNPAAQNLIALVKRYKDPAAEPLGKQEMAELQGGLRFFGGKGPDGRPLRIDGIDGPGTQQALEKFFEERTTYVFADSNKQLPAPDNPVNDSQIRIVQGVLKAYGHYQGRIDGQVGTGTLKGLAEFNKEQSLGLDIDALNQRGVPSQADLFKIQQWASAHTKEISAKVDALLEDTGQRIITTSDKTLAAQALMNISGTFTRMDGIRGGHTLENARELRETAIENPTPPNITEATLTGNDFAGRTGSIPNLGQ
jgi:peptidoglycan hydrolase-like protein with peptidoglycan-binding domain